MAVETVQREAPAGVKTGRFAVIEQFLSDGMKFMFGNPGTVEQGFLDAMEQYPDMRYILTLQETIAVLIADGYARATQRPTLVQIHSTPGLGNAIGALYPAKRGHSPLVVIGGDAGIRYAAMDAQMAGDLVAMAEPVTKWATMVQHPSSLLRVLRKAIKIAATPPMGPVYVCLPQDILDAAVEEEVHPTLVPSTRVLPDPALVQEAARMLVAAERPVFFVGDGVAFSGAQAELTRLAELVGAEVWDSDAGEVNMSWSHPLYQGATGHMFGSHSLPILSRGDVNFVCGTYIVPEVFPELGKVWRDGARVIHADLNAYEIGKNHPVSMGVVSDPKLSMAALAEAVAALQSDAQKKAAAERVERLKKEQQARLQSEKEQDARRKGQTPHSMAEFVQELAAQAPDDIVIFDEALTNSPPIARYLPPSRTGQYFLTRGGSLGVGIPGGIGVKLAQPDKTVIAFTGDGGSMYTIQALWSAARHNVDAKFVICNNSSYRLLQLNISQYWKESRVAEHAFPLSFDLSNPPLGFVDMAKGLGVPAVRVERPEEMAVAIQKALSHKGPFVIDLVLEGTVHPELVGVRCGQ